MEYIPDYTDLHAEYEREQERRLAMYPRCSSCNETITDDVYYVINDRIYCEDCLNDQFGHSTEDYLEDY